MEFSNRSAVRSSSDVGFSYELDERSTMPELTDWQWPTHPAPYRGAEHRTWQPPTTPAHE